MFRLFVCVSVFESNGKSRGGGHTSDNTCSFSDTVPASLHSHLWFEGFGYRHIRYRLAVSTWEALEP